MKYIKNKAYEYLKTSIVRDYYLLDNVSSGNGLFNRRCHQNAVQVAIKNNYKLIAMCICVNKEDEQNIFMHFVNDNTNEFVDNTLGVWSTKFDYYFVSYIQEKDFFNIVDIFCEQRDKIVKRYVPWWCRWLSDVGL